MTRTRLITAIELLAAGEKTSAEDLRIIIAAARRAPVAVSVEELRAQRDRNVAECYRKHYWAARSLSSGITAFLIDLNRYERTRWSRDHHGECPYANESKDAYFFEILKTDLPILDDRQIRRILKRLNR